MLVLTRKKYEKIQIGPDIAIEVVSIGQHTVKLGIDAPPNVNVVRSELLENGGKLREMNDA